MEATDQVTPVVRKQTMLIALMLGVRVLFGANSDALFGGPWLEQGKKQVKLAVTDEARRESALKSVSRVDEDIKKLDNQVANTEKEMKRLVRNYRSTPEEFDALFSSALANRKQLVEALLDDRETMLKDIRPNEWQSIIAGMQVQKRP